MVWQEVGCSSGSHSKECDGSSSCKVLDTVSKSQRMGCLIKKTKVARKESFIKGLYNKKITSYPVIKAIIIYKSTIIQ